MTFLFEEKSKLNRFDLIDYFAQERLHLSEDIIKQELLRFEKALDEWTKLIANSFLSQDLQERYENLIRQRWQRIKF